MTSGTSIPSTTRLSEAYSGFNGNETSVVRASKRRKVGSLSHSDYTVGWVCALPKEQTAATAMLDERHPDLPKPHTDQNTYTLGSIGEHNIVIACLPLGTIGNSSSAAVAATMAMTFPMIKFGLMVGIGGGVPSKVRLGDVVVSTPVGHDPGVIQWDFGKTKQTATVAKNSDGKQDIDSQQGDTFERIGALTPPPRSLLTALTKLKTEHELSRPKISAYLEDIAQRYPPLASKYLKSASLQDIVFKSDVIHVSQNSADDIGWSNIDDEDAEEEVCKYCDKANAITRKPKEPRVHYGLIASGNQVIKNAVFRDKLIRHLGSDILCFEMEAAGLMNNFPCLIIRGICDYADSHKNKQWQEHAAAVAAAFAKEVLQHVQSSDVAGECAVKDVLNKGQPTLGFVQ